MVKSLSVVARPREVPQKAVPAAQRVVQEVQKVVQALAKEALELERVVQALEREVLVPERAAQPAARAEPGLEERAALELELELELEQRQALSQLLRMSRLCKAWASRDSPRPDHKHVQDQLLISEATTTAARMNRQTYQEEGLCDMAALACDHLRVHT